MWFEHHPLLAGFRAPTTGSCMWFEHHPLLSALTPAGEGRSEELGRVELVDRDDPHARQAGVERLHVVLEVEELEAPRRRGRRRRGCGTPRTRRPPPAARRARGTPARRSRRRCSPGARRPRAARSRRACAGSRCRRPSRRARRTAARGGSRWPAAPARTSWGARSWPRGRTAPSPPAPTGHARTAGVAPSGAAPPAGDGVRGSTCRGWRRCSPRRRGGRWCARPRPCRRAYASGTRRGLWTAVGAVSATRHTVGAP